MRGWNRVRRLLAEDRVAIGAFVSIPAVQVVQALGAAGADFVLIDQEHAPVDAGSLGALIAASAASGTMPFVRVAGGLVRDAKLALDLGAAGINVPMTRTRADAEAGVAAVRYPPRGERQWGPFYAPMRWGRTMRQYQDEACDEILLMATLEHPDSDAAAIFATPGIDAAAIGVGDLATAIGFKGQVERPEVQAIVAEWEKEARKARVPLAGLVPSVEAIPALRERGYRLLVPGFDWALLQRGVAPFVAATR